MLIIEDLETVQGTWRREVDDFNAETSINFDASYVGSMSEAVSALTSGTFDCGIVDLRLPAGPCGTETEATQGNIVITEITSRAAIPIAVVSGYPAELSLDFQSIPIKKFAKDAENYRAALDWLATHQELMFNIRSAQEAIARETARLFHGSLWPRWGASGALPSEPPASRRASMLRQIASHLTEHLALPSSGTPRFSPTEFYFKPSIRERLHTGDLLKLELGLFIILTPQCNIANEYPSHLIVAPCIEKRDWADILAQLKHQNLGKRESAEKKLRDFSNHATALSTHFLPPCDQDGPWLVDFKNCQTIPCNIELLKPKRFASLAPQFLPNLTQRFAAYMGRIGQPDIDIEELARQLALLPKS